MKIIIANALRAGTNFAMIEVHAPSTPAAKHKGTVLEKRFTANVQLFNGVHDNPYANAVKRSAVRINENGPDAIADFEVQDSLFVHTDCYSIVAKRSDMNELYLYAIMNSVNGVGYYVNGVAVDINEYASYLTPSAAKTLLNDNSIVYNKTYNILHTVHPRTIKLTNIKRIKVNKQTYTF